MRPVPRPKESSLDRATINLEQAVGPALPHEVVQAFAILAASLDPAGK